MSTRPIALLFLALLLAPAAAGAAPRALWTARLSGPADFTAWASSGPLGGGGPAVLGVVDHQDGDRVYWADGRRFDTHMDFMNAAGLTLARGMAFYSQSVDTDRRRFTMLFLREPARGAFELELWQDDAVDAATLRRVVAAARAAGPPRLSLRPRSPSQAQAASQAGLEALPFEEPPFVYAALNTGVTAGRLRFVSGPPEKASTGPEDIPVFDTTPAYLPPLTGFLVSRPVTAASHMVILARSLGVPAAALPDASRWRELDGQDVVLEVGASTCAVRPATPAELEAARASRAARRKVKRLAADLRWGELTDLSAQRGADGRRFGAKSANLGQVMASVPEAAVPPGFTVPFRHYVEFLRRNGLDARVEQALAELAAAPEKRDAVLASLRAAIEAGGHSPELRAALTRKLAEHEGRGMFVRSSTNAEDLPGFTGAGLYTTVPNVVGLEETLEAIKTVWASLWNERAFVAREAFGIDHRTALPAVLVQRTADAQAAGVMLTVDPRDPRRGGVVHISAKKGLGMRVVEGRAVPEQALWDARSGRIEWLSRSADDLQLKADPKGGVRPVSVAPGAPVLTPELVAKLGKVASAVSRAFGGTPQDIEWVVEDGRVVIVQARPYPAGETAAAARP